MSLALQESPVLNLEHFFCFSFNSCVITGLSFYIAYLAPILLVVTCNLIILAMILKALLKPSPIRKNNKMEGMAKVRIAAGISILMGSTWIIGLFAVYELTFTFQLLFCIFNSLQGFFIFIFYCLRNKDAQKEWLSAVGIERS